MWREACGSDHVGDLSLKLHSKRKNHGIKERREERKSTTEKHISTNAACMASLSRRFVAFAITQQMS